jgi:3-oxoadipate enol-lactonase
MPFLVREGCRLYWRVDGKPGLPVLVLGSSLGTDLHMWHPLVDALTERFRVVRMDTRGHGASGVPPGDYAIADLGCDVLAVCDHLDVDRFAFCGLSLGAMVGQWLALQSPQRISGLVLANAAAYLPSRESWSARMATARDKGMGALVDMVMERFFSQAYRDRDEALYHSMRTTFAETEPQGYAACCAAVRDADFRPRLGEIGAPTLVIAGERDAATPVQPFAAELVAGIPGARLHRLDAGHISSVEQPAAFRRALIAFLQSLSHQQEPDA